MGEASNDCESGIAQKAIEVIVVEDDDDARALLAMFLERRKCSVRAFADALSAQEAAVDHAPDVVVTDLRLLGSAGWTLAAALREDARTRHVALVAVTGEVEPRREVIESFDAYLRKPIDLERIADLVEQLAAISRSARLQRRGG